MSHLFNNPGGHITEQDLLKLANNILDTPHCRLDNVIHETRTSITSSSALVFYKKMFLYIYVIYLILGLP